MICQTPTLFTVVRSGFRGCLAEFSLFPGRPGGRTARRAPQEWQNSVPGAFGWPQTLHAAG
jgi:hypothetical protein